MKLQYNYELQASYTLYLFFYFLIILYYFTDLIKNLELCIRATFIRIKFRHTQISVPKIGITVSKTACINPYVI